MVAGSKQVAVSKTISLNGVEEAVTSLMSGAKNILLVIEISNYVDGSYVLELSHSPNGSDYEVLGSCAALAANGFEKFIVSGPTFETFKLKVTSSTVTSGADIKASLIYTSNRL